MTWTNWGFDGTINESQWAQMAGLLGNGYVALNSSSCVVTAVPGARSVSVSAGTLYGDGVVSVNASAKTVAMTTPVNGQWYVIALRRTWATNTVELVAVAGATTTTTTPTAPPSTLPTLNANVGVLADQPIAWAWTNSANTTVVVFDMRKLPQKQANPESVANANDRTAKFPSPIQGTTVWRNDLGALETYYDLYNVSTNPNGRNPAGWYQGALQTPRYFTGTLVAGTYGGGTAIGVTKISGNMDQSSNWAIAPETGFYLITWQYRITAQGGNVFPGLFLLRGGSSSNLNTLGDFLEPPEIVTHQPVIISLIAGDGIRPFLGNAGGIVTGASARGYFTMVKVG